MSRHDGPRRPHPHEFAANYIYDDDGLRPFFGCDYVVKMNGGSHVAEFELDGETWMTKLYYQNPNILNPGETTPQGTKFALGEIREFRIHVFRHPREDPVKQQKMNCHLTPRWQGMHVENNDGEVSKLSIPDDLVEGVNVRAVGSNIEFDRYQRLLQRAASAHDINSGYFADPHDHSNVQDAERYVRLHKDRSGPIHARDGPIAKMAHLMESDRDGYRKLVQNERDEHGRHLPGYYHAVTLGPRQIEAAFPSHSLPKEVKHYYSREAAGMPESEPLAHPKLGASYQVSRWDETLGVEGDDLAQLIEELEETVLAVLAEAGVPVRPGDADGEGVIETRGPYVPDAYFEGTESDRNRNLVSLNLTKIEQQQESIVIKHLSDGLSPVEWESLEMLVTDGGRVSPTDIADEYGRHVDSVRRALGRLPDLIEHDYGCVKLRNDHIAEYVHDEFNQLENGVPLLVTLQSAGEDELFIQLSRSPLTKHGETYGWVVLAQDVTVPEQQRRELKEQNKRLDEFASVVSHDLRNPLAVAEGWLEVAREEADSEHLETVARAHNRIHVLIDDLLTLARQGERPESVEPIRLSQIVTSAWKNVETKDAHLDVAVDLTISANSSWLTQLLENLFRNAIEYGGEDVSVAVGNLDNGFYLEDDGPGIPRNDKEHVFESGFSTGDNGTGFGLSIVSTIADVHDWSIKVAEGTEGGARFEFRDVEIEHRSSTV